MAPPRSFNDFQRILLYPGAVRVLVAVAAPRPAQGSGDLVEDPRLGPRGTVVDRQQRAHVALPLHLAALFAGEEAGSERESGLTIAFPGSRPRRGAGAQLLARRS